MNNSLPYKVEYTVGVQNCKKCRKKIRSGVLKVAIMMQVIHLDGRISNINIKHTYVHLLQSEEDDCQYPDWYHQKCFFQTHLPKTEAAFDGFANLRYSDQLGIKERLGKIKSNLIHIHSITVQPFLQELLKRWWSNMQPKKLKGCPNSALKRLKQFEVLVTGVGKSLLFLKFG